MTKSIIYDARLAATILILFRFSLGSSALHHHVPPDLNHVPLAHICARFHLGKASNDLAPVLMLHGIMGSKQKWNGIQDARDHGDSPWTNKTTVDAMALDLDYFMEQYNMSKAILIGHSMGGLTSMKLALSKPEKVEKLIVEDISPRAIHINANEFASNYKALKESLSVIPEGTDLQTAKRILHDYLKPKKPGDDEERRNEDADRLSLKIENGIFKWKTNFDGLIATFQNEENFMGELSGIFNGNALFIYGTESPLKVYDDRELILKLFPKAQLFGIETDSHVLHRDFPQQYMMEVLKFINGH